MIGKCTKKPYKSKGAAEAHLRSLLQRGDDFKDSSKLCTYLHSGHGWHVGHRPDLRISAHNEVPVPLVFDGEYLMLACGGERRRIGRRKPSGEWAFYTLGSTHGNLLDEILEET